MSNTGADDSNSQGNGRVAEKNRSAAMLSDDAIEAAAGTDCACTYLPSRLSTTFRFIDNTLIKVFGP